jgi:hypothetical protein
MTPQQALEDFYRKYNFQPGKKSWTIGVYVGCMLVPLPNIETRHRYIMQHDLHHIITGYGVARIGEGEVSAWELGTGSMRHPMLGFMNLIALSTGYFLAHERMKIAFMRGLRCKNLYACEIREGLGAKKFATIDELRAICLDVRAPRSVGFAADAEFYFYVALAMGIHALVVLPAIVFRTITDLLLDWNLFPKVVDKARVKAAQAASRQA